MQFGLGEKGRKSLQVVLGIGIAGACLWLAVPGSNLASKWEGLKASAIVLKTAQYWWLMPLIVLLAFFFYTKALRWARMLNPIRSLTMSQVFPATMIGFMGNNVLPAHLGELIRMYVLSRTYLLSKASVLASIVLERVLDAIAITVLFAVTGLSLALPKAYIAGGFIGGSAVTLAVICLFLYVYRTEMFLSLWDRCCGFLPKRVHGKIAQMIRSGSRGLDTLRNPGVFVFLALFSVFHWALLALYIYLVFRAFSIDLPFSAALLVLCGNSVAAMIPSAPGYWGVIQAVFTIALRPLGVPQESALAASIYYLASQYVPTTLTGFIFMVHMGFHLGELKAGVEMETLNDCP